MHFYHYKIKQSSTINHVVKGNFSGCNKPEIVISRGRILEVLTVNLSSGALSLLLSFDFNATIFSVELVPGQHKDYVAVGSDSGKIVILEFKLMERCFVPIKEHKLEENKFDVSCRFTPGQYVAVDPESQALAVGAIEEKLKFYNLCKDAKEFSNPVTICKPRFIFFDLVSVFNGIGIPFFACLEAQYEEEKYPVPQEISDPSKPGSSKQSIDNLVKSYCPHLSIKKVNKPRPSSPPVEAESEEPVEAESEEPNEFEKYMRKYMGISLSSLTNPLCSLKEEVPEANPPMTLRVFKWHWQSENMFEKEYPLTNHANKLVSVPPGDCHKGGVIVCFCNEILFLEIETDTRIQYFFPQRRNVGQNNKRGMLICSSAVYKKDDKLLIFLQAEEGDLYSTKIMKNDNGELEIKMTYIDTIPVSSAMCIIEGDFLFIGVDYGDHLLYKIKSLGSEDIFTNVKNIVNLFIARKLSNLEILSKIENFSPVINCIASQHVCIKNCFIESSVGDHVCDFLQFNVACGRETSSTLRTLRHGVEVIELISTKLPVNSYPDNMWILTEKTKDGLSTYIIISFKYLKTITLSMDREIKLVDKFNFDEEIELLDCVQINEDISVQILSDGFQYAYQGNETRKKLECCCPVKVDTDICVVQCAVYKDQLALALKCKELIYIEALKCAEGTFEFKEARMKGITEFGAYCMEFVSYKPKAEFLVVCLEESIQVYSVNLEGIFCIAKNSLPSLPESLIVCSEVNQPISYMTIGFVDGSVQRAILNEEMQIVNTFSLKLGSKRVRLIKTKIGKEYAILALSSHAWVSFDAKSQFEFVPLLYEKLDCAVPFSTQQCPLANLVAVSNQNLIFLGLKNFSSLFSENRQAVELTPRHSLFNPKHKNIIISHSDCKPPGYRDGDMTPQLAMDLTLGNTDNKEPNPNAQYMSELVQNMPPANYECELSIFDPVKKEFIFYLELPDDIIPTRMCLAEFSSKPNEQYLVVAVKESVYFAPGAGTEERFYSYLYLYEISDDGKSLLEINKIKMRNTLDAVCPFEGHILIGVKNVLWLCDLEDNVVMQYSLEMPCPILNIYAKGSLFVVLCKNRNVIYGYWDKNDDKLVKLHEDYHLKKVTTLCFWDDNIMIAADVYGYLNVVLLPTIPKSFTNEKIRILKINYPKEVVNQEAKEEPSVDEYRFMSKNYIIVKHYLGEVVTSLQKTTLQNEGRNVVLYTTLSGVIGVLVPFLNEKADIIFKPLQYLIKGKSYFHNKDSTEWPNDDENISRLCENQPDLLLIDGSLYDLFNTLPEADRLDIAKYLDKKPYEISEKLAEIKAKIYFEDNPENIPEAD